LCAVARGIVRGVAKHFGESVSITDRACMHRGDAECVIVVTKS
jgi:predicted hydrocarbon binding protein